MMPLVFVNKRGYADRQTRLAQTRFVFVGPRRGGRVVDRAALEMRSTARYRGFKSLPLRHHSSSSRYVKDL
jgi:hypothetical protein